MMNLVCIGDQGLLGTRRRCNQYLFHTDGAGGPAGHNHRRRSSLGDVVPTATVRVTCLAGIDYF